MTLGEAISILAAKRMDDVERNAESSAEACQLGIEALKRFKTFRGIVEGPFSGPLPGETKE